ncbi:Pou domain - to homeobox domain protein, partial [Teladorsagia circumcincta]
FTQRQVASAIPTPLKYSQTTISRFESLALSVKNMYRIKVVLNDWLEKVDDPLKKLPMADPQVVLKSRKTRRSRTNIKVNQLSVIGSVLNISAVVLIYRTPWFHNAFGFICASHLLADVGVLVIFMFWAAPAALLGYSDAITESYFGKRMGQLTMVFWYAAIYGQLQIALNRLIAILSPMLYK